MQTEDADLSSQIIMPVNVSEIRLRLMIGVIMVLLLAQCFNAGLSISHFTKLHTDSMVSLSRVYAQSLQLKLSNDISLGKPLKQFFGIDTYMQEIQDSNQQITNVRIADNKGTVIYGIDKKGIGEKLPKSLDIVFGDVKPTSALNQGDLKTIATASVLFADNYHILLPIKDHDKVWLGTIDISFPVETIDNEIKEIVKRNLQVLAATTIIAALLLFLGLALFVRIQRGAAPPRRQIYLVVLLVVGFAQVLYSSFNIFHFEENNSDIMESNIEKSADALHKELERWFVGGVKIERLPGMAAWMQKIVLATPEVENMSITAADGELLYRATATSASDIVLVGDEGNGDPAVEEKANLNFLEAVSEPLFQLISPVSVPLSNGDRLVGNLHVQPSSSMLRVRVGEIVADSLTVLIISLLFVGELIIFLLILIDKQIYQSRVAGTLRTSNYGLIRPAAFFYLFAVDLSVSFLPLHMGNLYDPNDPIFGLSRELVMGLPYSVSMFFAAIMMVVSGAWMDRRGWHEPFFVGVLLTAVGACLAGLAESPMEFIGARAIMGVGYGSTIISIQGFIYNRIHDRLQSRGITNLFAALFAGSICGTVSGGMLAERLGFSAVFFVSTVMAIIVILFASIFMTQTFIKPEAKRAHSAKLSPGEWLRFIFDRNIFSLVIFSSVPGALVMAGVLYYASPIYLKQEGIGQGHIGRIVMLYGLCMIYLAPLAGRLVDRIGDKRPIIFLSGVCAALGVCAFYLFEGASAVIVTIGMLGIAGSLGAASHSIYALNLRATQRFGQGRAMGLYKSIERLGQVLGPLVVGSMILLFGGELKDALLMLGGMFFLASLLFLFISKAEPAVDRQPVNTTSG